MEGKALAVGAVELGGVRKALNSKMLKVAYGLCPEHKGFEKKGVDRDRNCRLDGFLQFDIAVVNSGRGHPDWW